MEVHIGPNYFCNVTHEQEFYLSVCKRVSDEIDAKRVKREESENSAFPPLPNAGAEPVTWHPPPTLLDRTERIRNKLLEMPNWSTPKTKRQKTTETSRAVPKAQFPGPAISRVPGPQEPHPPAAEDITMEVKLMIASAESAEEVDKISELVKEHLPETPVPAVAAMEVEVKELILTKEEEKSFIDFKSQQEGSPTPGVE